MIYASSKVIFIRQLQSVGTIGEQQAADRDELEMVILNYSAFSYSST